MSRVRSVGQPDGLFELRRTRNHTVILLVSVVDRRIVPALHFVSRLACNDSRALHISSDPDETRRLAADWMNLGLSWLPLHIRDDVCRDPRLSIVDAVRREAQATSTVTIVLPELDVPGWCQRLLHRDSARRIAVELQLIPAVTAVIVPFPAPRPGRLRRSSSLLARATGDVESSGGLGRTRSGRWRASPQTGSDEG